MENHKKYSKGYYKNYYRRYHRRYYNTGYGRYERAANAASRKDKQQ